MGDGKVQSKARGQLSLRQDVVSVILNRGELSKSDIKRIWSLGKADYARLKAELSNERLLAPRRDADGGFAAKFLDQPEVSSPSPLPTPMLANAWERAAAERLASVLGRDELERALGESVHALRRARTLATQQDRPSTRAELAAALLVRHGSDLLLRQDVRAPVARTLALTVPPRWRPGKGAARRFAREAGFPRELAGQNDRETDSDYDDLLACSEPPRLAPFQAELRERLLEVLGAGGRAVVSLPTAAGKTRLAMDTVRDWLTRRWRDNPDREHEVVLWLVSSEEACEPAYACLREHWLRSREVCPLRLARGWGEHAKTLPGAPELDGTARRPVLLVSTAAGLVERLAKRSRRARALRGWLQAHAALLLVDDADPAATLCYERLLRTLGSSARAPAVMGLTGIPMRAEDALLGPNDGAAALLEVFRQILTPTRSLSGDPQAVLEAAGVVAPLRCSAVRTRTLMVVPEPATGTSASTEELDRMDHALRIRADHPQRRWQAFERIAALCEERRNRIVYYGPSAADALCMAVLLRQRGIDSGVVSRGARAVMQRMLIDDLRAGTLAVLCASELLVTGLESLQATHFVIARPTASGLLYEQMIAPALRGPVFGGVDGCVVIDLEDRYRSTQPKLGYQQFRERGLDPARAWEDRTTAVAHARGRRVR
jgi:DNA repair protein RadD